MDLILLVDRPRDTVVLLGTRRVSMTRRSFLPEVLAGHDLL
jgi:hypothetical protein